MKHEIVDVIFLLLGAAITAGSILFYRWINKEFKSDKNELVPNPYHTDLK